MSYAASVPPPAQHRPARATGRRPGNSGTRETVLAAARATFAERGFEGATIRAIATAAGVDPALVHHYFGTKDQLFLAAVQAPVDPERLLPEMLGGAPESLGADVVRMLLHLWDGPAGPGALALLRSAVGSERMAALLREFLLGKVLRRIVGTLGLPEREAEARGALVATQLIGLVMARYVLRIEPVASAPPGDLVAACGPTVQRYLTGDITLPVGR